MREVFLNGSAGKIEGKYYHNKDVNAPLALILHPHPQYGGSMDNKIVYNLYNIFINNGFSVLRINFRGVGKSTGSFDKGVGELNDGATAADWLQNNNPSIAPFWVAGFSFGAWIAMQLVMRRPEIEGFIAVSPPANKYDFSFLSPCPIPGLIVQGDNDSISDECVVSQLASKLKNSIKSEYMQYCVIEKADHFFRDHIDTFYQVVDSYIKSRLLFASNQPSNIVHRKMKHRVIMQDEPV
ncbi:alpha/beta hydrolase [Neoehrlichia mikurensis]|uniref:Alpha/beta hydrolase n=1 Tax=Neoehrlichia mikurensis TaxID=89586 RepID=A0A9Q9C0J4_9RICK|nr:alpha/beta hydrolase [Neoehrlichia mikurensis]QXK91913.1 alpha/beta hydrolase [Neoehrlichia mikurensis]QXK93126.1 alpha/beta hydrolase [Neoehrlichia mikurensis]QXK93606.1 alpha/beta hydrolase [Neoehrlichia mikurensis]UTO55439.1 alpha/beta hydrolase [Neoehrlichia mikurensis]UTO56359.1 alpha/beta hydrolase [Neoehrlichia mikurensis]